MPVVGGDPLLIRAARLDPKFDRRYSRECAGTMEVPCQQCGQTVLLAPGGVSVALGDPTACVELDTAATVREDRIVGKGLPIITTRAEAVQCWRCAFADKPELLEIFVRKLAEARKLLGEQ
jgi:hypothetical protein